MGRCPGMQNATRVPPSLCNILKLLIQQIHPHVRVECDSGMCVARDLYELWGRSPYTLYTPACLWPARRSRSRRSSHVVHDTAPIPGIIIPGAREKDLHPRSSCQRVVEGVVHLLFSGVQGDHRPVRCGEAGYPRG
jgi:hypothetical protein